MRFLDELDCAFLQALAKKMIADGTMPDLDTLLDAVEEIRKEYRPKILEARRHVKIHSMRCFLGKGYGGQGAVDGESTDHGEW